MSRDGNAIHKAKPVDQHKPLTGGIRQSVVPLGRLEGDQTVRSDMPRSFDRLGEAEEIARRAAERCFSNECAATLAARDQPFVDKLLDGFGNCEPADAPILRQLGLAGNPRTSVESADLLAKPVGNLDVKRTLAWFELSDSCRLLKLSSQLNRFLIKTQ